MPWSELAFVKHRGKTLPQALFADPDWVLLGVRAAGHV